MEIKSQMSKKGKKAGKKRCAVKIKTVGAFEKVVNLSAA